MRRQAHRRCARDVTLVMPAMPAMGMPEMKSSFELPWMADQPDVCGQRPAPMSGTWNVLVEARKKRQRDRILAHTSAPGRRAMINRIIEFSMKNRWLILAVYAALAVWGYWALLHTPIDAIPDLSENQVIVFTEWQGRSPQEVEDQITYPLTVNLQGLPHVRTVRSASAFGFSMVNVIFEDSVDIYFARTRVLERLSLAGSFLPAGVTPMMGPDATGVGQVFWYTVEGPYDSGTLHSIQDWFIKYQLNSVPGVAEVASVGGFVKQYQIDLDPIKLRAYNVALKDVVPRWSAATTMSAPR
jgi:Cu/Ag efflux pump CusA